MKILVIALFLFGYSQIGKTSNFYLGDETDDMDENDWILIHSGEEHDVYKQKVNPHHQIVLTKGFNSPFIHEDDLVVTTTWVAPEMHEFELRSQKLKDDGDTEEIYGLKMVVRIFIQLSRGIVTDTFVPDTFVVDTGGLSFLNLKPSTWKFWKENKLLNRTDDPDIWKTQIWPGFYIPVRKTSDSVDHANLLGLPFLHPLDLHIKNSTKNDNVTLDNFPMFFSRFQKPAFEVLHPIRHPSPNFWKQEFADTKNELEKTKNKLTETEEEGKKTRKMFKEFVEKMKNVLGNLGVSKDQCESLTQNFEGEDVEEKEQEV